MSSKHLERISELQKQLNQRERELRQCGHTIAQLAEQKRELKEKLDSCREAALSDEESMSPYLPLGVPDDSDLIDEDPDDGVSAELPLGSDIDNEWDLSGSEEE